MNYRITVSQNGSHLFSTQVKSLLGDAVSEAVRLAKILRPKFPESEGYQVTLSVTTTVREELVWESLLKEIDNV